MLIRFGIWDHFERRPACRRRPSTAEDRSPPAAERLGFYAYHLAEHHLSPLDLAPSPNVFLAALAQATTLRIGTMVHILPLYHPSGWCRSCACSTTFRAADSRSAWSRHPERRAPVVWHQLRRTRDRAATRSSRFWSRDGDRQLGTSRVASIRFPMRRWTCSRSRARIRPCGPPGASISPGATG